MGEQPLAWNVAGVQDMAGALDGAAADCAGGATRLAGAATAGGGPDAAAILADVTATWSAELRQRGAATDVLASALPAQTAAVTRTDASAAR